MQEKKSALLTYRIPLIRSVYSLNKANFAKSLEISAAYVTDLESGKNQKLSKTLAKLISYEFDCDFDWVYSGVLDKARCDLVIKLVNSVKTTKEELARRTKKTTAYVDAVLNYLIVPSDIFINNACVAFSHVGPGIEKAVKCGYKAQNEYFEKDVDDEGCDDENGNVNAVYKDDVVALKAKLGELINSAETIAEMRGEIKALRRELDRMHEIVSRGKQP